MNSKRITALFGLLLPTMLTDQLSTWRRAMASVIPAVGNGYVYAAVPARSVWRTTQVTSGDTVIRDAATSASFVFIGALHIARYQVCSDVS